MTFTFGRARNKCVAIFVAITTPSHVTAAQTIARSTPERKTTVALLEFDNGAMIRRNEFARLRCSRQTGIKTNAKSALSITLRDLRGEQTALLLGARDEILKSLTGKQLQAAAKKYFVRENSLVVTLVRP